MNDCLFCKIIKGDIPSYKVYEDDKVLAFLDVNPNSDGHTLVIPKEHYENLFTTPNELIIYMIDVIKTKIYPILKEKLNIDGLTICQNNYYGQDVKHYHIHLIPRYNSDSFKCT
ncbi:MAG TPA: HIT family protein, partial [Candidatus Onthousia faecipullorum]|nr:HIT family protein [Candidatus Onthousia faecipullorum]